MGLFLNSIAPYDKYKTISEDPYFMDKSALLEELMPAAGVISYNNETERAAVVNLVYLSARDKYKIEREDKAGKGVADFIFYPRAPGCSGIILELKADHSPEEAIRQIKEKEYPLKSAIFIFIFRHISIFYCLHILCQHI